MVGMEGGVVRRWVWSMTGRGVERISTLCTFATI
jgi:hypothetical protein